MVTTSSGRYNYTQVAYTPTYDQGIPLCSSAGCPRGCVHLKLWTSALLGFFFACVSFRPDLKPLYISSRSAEFAAHCRSVIPCTEPLQPLSAMNQHYWTIISLIITLEDQLICWMPAELSLSGIGPELLHGHLCRCSSGVQNLWLGYVEADPCHSQCSFICKG